jgi:O-antigen/teichoic acid export membrane protein
LKVQNYLSHIPTLVKTSGIYALSSLASPLVQLVLAPFLTHQLSRSDYGVLAVLDTAIALLVGLTQLSLGSSFFRAYSYDYESPRDRSAVLSTLTILLSLTSIPVAVTMLIAAPWLSTLLFNGPSFSNPLRIAGLIILLQNLAVPGFSWLRAEDRPAWYSGLSIANLLISLSATIILVGLLRMGISGALLAIGCGYTVVVVCTLPVLLLRAGLRPRFDIARNLLSFGVPLACNFVAKWVLQLSDRYLLSHLASLAETASYSVAYSLGSALAVVIIAPFQLAWAAVMFAIAKRDDAAQRFRVVFRWFSIVLLLAAFALSLVALGMLDTLFPPAYHSAAPVIPIVAVSIVFYGIYAIFTVGISVRRKNWLAVIMTGLSAVVNVGANLILIPLYGSLGAAVSTCIAYIVLALIAYVVNQRIYPIPFEIGIFISALLIGIALYVGGNVFAQTQELYVAWGIRICSLGLYAGCLAFLGKLPARSLEKKHTQAQEISVP